MIEGWVLWLFLVGLAVGVVTSLILVVRLPRSEGDVAAEERPAEAAWISAVIERHGGIAPRLLVEEVLELHQSYLERGRPADGGSPRQASRPPVPPPPPSGYTRMPTSPVSPPPAPPPGAPGSVSGSLPRPPAPPGPPDPPRR